MINDININIHHTYKNGRGEGGVLIVRPPLGKG